MKTEMRKIIGCIVVFVMMTIFSLKASAAGIIEMDEELSLIIWNQYDGKGLEGMKYELYLLGTMDETGEISLLEPFLDYEKQLHTGKRKGDESKDLAAKIDGIITKMEKEGEQIGRISDVTDKEGKVMFTSTQDGLQQGLYLIRSAKLKHNGYRYATLPVLVTLPNQNMTENEWNYHLEIHAKIGAEPVQEQTLPQTGQLWWPAGILLAGGSGLLLWSYVSKKREQ